MKLISIFVLFSITVSCATKYKKHGYTGGYTDFKIGSDIYKVNFHGNGYTSQDTVYRYFLRRCAELTLENGYEYFAFVESDSSITTDPNYSFRKHSKEGVIKLFKADNRPQNALNAKETLVNLGNN